MKKFRFKFDAVLKIKKANEDEALRSLAESQRQYQVEISKKEQLKIELTQAQKRKENLAAEPTSITSFHVVQSFINGQKQRLIQADQAIFRASKFVEKSLRAYLMAKRQSKIFETLYDRAYSEFRKEKAKQEQKQNDDINLMRSRLKEEVL